MLQAAQVRTAGRLTLMSNPCENSVWEESSPTRRLAGRDGAQTQACSRRHTAPAPKDSRWSVRPGPALWVTGARKERRTKSSSLPVVGAAEEFPGHTATVWSPRASCQFRSRGTSLLTFRSAPAPVGPRWPGPLTAEGRRPPGAGAPSPCPPRTPTPAS